VCHPRLTWWERFPKRAASIAPNIDNSYLASRGEHGSKGDSVVTDGEEKAIARMSAAWRPCLAERTDADLGWLASDRQTG